MSLYFQGVENKKHLTEVRCFFMKKTCRRGQAPNNLLLDGINGSGLRSGGWKLLLLLLAGHEGGGGKSENSDGLHNFLVYVNFWFSHHQPGVGWRSAQYTDFFSDVKGKM